MPPRSKGLRADVTYLSGAFIFANPNYGSLPNKPVSATARDTPLHFDLLGCPRKFERLGFGDVLAVGQAGPAQPEDIARLMELRLCGKPSPIEIKVRKAEVAG